ncbi:MAG: heparinase II/III family protein [Oscillospiraceae bacterium]|nr:heparinase II/III family protein [Oscillospiraceae bacterium]
MLMAKAKDPAFWANARQDPAYQELVGWVTRAYKERYEEVVPSLSYRARMRYYKDGDRSEFEARYFRRRNCLASTALLALLYPEEPTYLEQTQELIWIICEEFSWVLPAHCENTLESAAETIDLFSAETAFTLAEIDYVLADRLDANVRARIRQQVEARILRNMETHTYFWETNTSNWSAVCAGNTGGALMYLFPEAFDKMLPRFIGAMESLMRGFPEDGTCTEGFGYWHYGFGNYIWFADLLCQYTDGKIDLLAVPKAAKVAGYAARSLLRGNTTVSFADGTMHGVISRTIQCYLAHRFPQDVSLLPAGMMEYNGINVHWMNYLRSFCYLEYEAFAEELVLKDHFLPDAQQVTFNRAKYSLAAKAGHNEEHHNHNDVGCFILATEKGQVFCDLGSGRYTRQYFQRPGRYEIFCNGSQGHSVPIVNGTYQKEGEQHHGSIAVDGDCITLELAGAYEAGTIEKLTRRIEALENGIRLTDTFSAFQTLTERFVTMTEPEVFANRIVVEDVTLYFDPAVSSVSVQEVVHLTHGTEQTTRTGKKTVGGGYAVGEVPVWCIDFAIAPGTESVEFRFEIME